MSILQTGHAEPTQKASAAGVQFQWVIKEATLLQGCLQANTNGWIAVGFNSRDGLAGTRLVMARVVNGHAHAEIHQADPPQHHHRSAPDGSEWVSNVTGFQSKGVTRICFDMPLAPSYIGDVALRASQGVSLTLAWSHEPDFEHHSAMRESIRVRL